LAISSGQSRGDSRYRMRSGNYRVIFFILHNRLVIEVISIPRKKTGIDY